MEPLDITRLIGQFKEKTGKDISPSDPIFQVLQLNDLILTGFLSSVQVIVSKADLERRASDREALEAVNARLKATFDDAQLKLAATVNQAGEWLGREHQKAVTSSITTLQSGVRDAVLGGIKDAVSSVESSTSKNASAAVVAARSSLAFMIGSAIIGGIIIGLALAKLLF